MKILFVSALLPFPLHSGGQIRIYNLLKRLAHHHEIHLYAFIRSNSEKKYLPELSFCTSVTTIVRGRVWQPKYILKTLTGSYPLLWSSYHNSEMLDVLADEISKGTYDLIHIEPGYVWPSIPTEHRIPVVVCEHNIEHAVYESFAGGFRIGLLRPLLLRDVVKMELWQRHVWKQAARIITVSESDKTCIHQPNVSVVPNGVDIKSFVFRPKKTMAKNMTFLYVGNFRWMENRDAAEHLVRDLWPAVQKEYPEARLRIVGNNAPKGPYFVGTVDRIQDERHDLLFAAGVFRNNIFVRRANLLLIKEVTGRTPSIIDIFSGQHHTNKSYFSAQIGCLQIMTVREQCSLAFCGIVESDLIIRAKKRQGESENEKRGGSMMRLRLLSVSVDKLGRYEQ